MLVTAQALAADPARDGRVAVRGSAEALSYPQLRAQAGAVVFYTDRYFAVVRSETQDRPRLTAFITALQKLLGVGQSRSSSG